MNDAMLLPTDGSWGAHAAVMEGLKLAREHDTRVHILFVNSSSDEVQERSSHTVRTDDSNGDAIPDKVDKAAEGLGESTERHDGVGDPAGVITQLAEDSGVEAISSSGRTVGRGWNDVARGRCGRGGSDGWNDRHQRPHDDEELAAAIDSVDRCQGPVRTRRGIVPGSGGLSSGE